MSRCLIQHGAYPISQCDERTNTYMEGTIRVRKKFAEVMYDDFPVSPSSCDSPAIQGDSNRPHPFGVRDGSANLGESR